MGPQLEALAKQNSKVRLRKIDVKSWSSPVAQQHGVNSLPHLVLYEGPRLVALGTQETGAYLEQRIK